MAENAAKPKQPETEYVILKAEPVATGSPANGGMGQVGYVEVGRETARKWDHAVDKFIAQTDGTVLEGAWKAVPARNWPAEDVISTNEQKVVPKVTRGKPPTVTTETTAIQEPVANVATPSREQKPVGVE